MKIQTKDSKKAKIFTKLIKIKNYYGEQQKRMM